MEPRRPTRCAEGCNLFLFVNLVVGVCFRSYFGLRFGIYFIYFSVCVFHRLSPHFYSSILDVLGLFLDLVFLLIFLCFLIVSVLWIV